MLRRRLAVLLAATMMLMMTLASGVAFADPGNGKGVGQGIGGGDIAHADNGKKLAKGGGRENNPH